jgi:hypothetical protein
VAIDVFSVAKKSLPGEDLPCDRQHLQDYWYGGGAQTCKLIALDQNIKSMMPFKQIIGSGARMSEELGKTCFSILDFKRATDISTLNRGAGGDVTNNDGDLAEMA